MTDYLERRIDLDDPAIAASFDEMSFWSSRFGALLFRHLELRRDLEILDLGCGTGFPLFELAQVHGPSCRCTGVDVWAPALARAAEKLRVHRHTNIALVRGDAAALPFRDAAFDLVVSNLGVNNFAAPETALAECARVTRPGGRLVLTTNPRGHLREVYGEFQQVLRDLHLKALRPRLAAEEAHRPTPQQLRKWLQLHGFVVSRILVEPFALRFLDGGAFLRHVLTRVGFLDGWRRVVEPADEVRVFAALEARLDARARSARALVLTVPMAYVEGVRRAARFPRRHGGPTEEPSMRKKTVTRARATRKTPARTARPVARLVTRTGAHLVLVDSPTTTTAPDKAAGISDATVRDKTGKSWGEWFTLLDRAGATGWSHTDIAAYLRETLTCPSWWNQMIAVGYEQARGMRQRYQTARGFSVSCSKTVHAPVSALYAAWSDARSRRRWLGEARFEVRKATPRKSLRLTWSDATSVEVGFISKGPGKAQVSVQHSKLPDAEAVDILRTYWADKLERLRSALES